MRMRVKMIPNLLVFTDSQITNPPCSIIFLYNHYALWFNAYKDIIRIAWFNLPLTQSRSKFPSLGQIHELQFSLSLTKLMPEWKFHLLMHHNIGPHSANLPEHTEAVEGTDARARTLRFESWLCHHRTLGKLSNLFMPQFSPLQNDNDKLNQFVDYVSKWIMRV